MRSRALPSTAMWKPHCATSRNTPLQDTLHWPSRGGDRPGRHGEETHEGRHRPADSGCDARREIHRIWYNLRAQALFAPDLRAATAEIERNLENVASAFLQMERSKLSRGIVHQTFLLLDAHFFDIANDAVRRRSGRQAIPAGHPATPRHNDLTRQSVRIKIGRPAKHIEKLGRST